MFTANDTFDPKRPWDAEIKNLPIIHKLHAEIIADLVKGGITPEQWGQVRKEFESLGETPKSLTLVWVSKIVDLKTGEIAPGASHWTWFPYPSFAKPSKLKFVEIAKDASELLTGVANEDVWLDLLRERGYGFSGSLEEESALRYSPGFWARDGKIEYYVSGQLYNIFVYSAQLAREIENDLGRYERKRRSQISPSPEVGAIPAVTTVKAPRLSGSVHDPEVANAIGPYLERKRISLTDFAGLVGTTDRTIRNFRNKHKVRRDIYDNIVGEIGIIPRSPQLATD